MTRRMDAGRCRIRRAGLLVPLLALAGGAAWAASSQHTVTEHDCLWELSRQYYKDPYRWRVISEANPQVQNPNLIYPGQVITIPEAAAGTGAKVELESPAPMATGAKVDLETPAPVETGAAVEAPEPQSPVPVAAPAPVKELPRAEEPARRPEKGIVEDSLSTQFPQGQASQYPSFPRFQAPKGWKEDGRVTEFNDEEIIAGPGDLAEAKMTGKVPAQVGESLYIVRADVPNDDDKDQEATYLQRVGVARVESILPKGRVRLRVLKAGGAVEAGDFLSRQGL